MAITILSLILFLIFTILSGFHFYWMLGGQWGTDKVFPTKSNEINTIRIPKFAALIVALGLLAFGLIYFVKTEIIAVKLPKLLSNYAYWLIPSIFIIRAIGEFRYVGFFKKIKETPFAKADTKIFSPLSLLIGGIGVLIQILS